MGLAKIIILLQRLVVAFFVSLVYRPARFIFRLLFYKVIVKLYGRYLWLMKRLGWSGFRENAWAFLFDQKLVHILVALVTVILVFSNLTETSRAQTAEQNGSKTILSSLITSEFGTQEEEQLIEEFFDQEETISPTQQNYLDSLSAVREQPIAEMNPAAELGSEFEANKETPGLVRPDLSGANQTERLRRETIAYSVQPGDTVSTIAERFSLSVNTILWANNLSAYSLIRPGDQLSILPVSGVMHTVGKGDTIKSIAGKYNIDESRIREFNELYTDQIAVGQKIMIPGGSKSTYAPYRADTRSGIAVLRDLITSTKKPAPLDRKLYSGNKMAWPTVGYRITQYFTWRHFAIDIANKVGTPLYASDSGEVEVAGWGRGYGNQVLVDHGGGKKTRYAHMSKILVRPGQQVEKGEVIGLMGSTGWSTGSHVHFEVIINGAKKNPLNYVR